MALRGPADPPFRLERVVPVDLAVACLWVALGVLLAPADNAVIRWLVIVPAFGFFLGYLGVAALFPAGGEVRARRVLGLAGRSALAFGASVALLVLAGVGLGLAGSFGLALLRLTLGIAGAVLAVVAVGRWYDLRPQQRWTPVPDPPAGARTGRGMDRLVIVAALLALAGVAFLAVRPPPQEPFTEVYLLGANGTADCYPDTFRNGTYRTSSVGCPRTIGNLTIGIRNLEGRSMDYRLEVAWADPEGGADRVVLLDERVSLPAVDARLDGTHTPQFERELALDGGPPASPARLEVLVYAFGQAAPHRSLHLWVQTVS